MIRDRLLRSHSLKMRRYGRPYHLWEFREIRLSERHIKLCISYVETAYDDSIVNRIVSVQMIRKI